MQLIKTIRIAATLGSPAAECANFGVCTVEVLSPEQWETFRPAHARHVKAVLGIAVEGTLLFSFHVQSMLPATRRRFFPAAGFQVDAPLNLPPGICEALSLPATTSFLSGFYHIEDTGESLNVALPLSLSVVQGTAA